MSQTHRISDHAQPGPAGPMSKGMNKLLSPIGIFFLLVVSVLLVARCSGGSQKVSNRDARASQLVLQAEDLKRLSDSSYQTAVTPVDMWQAEQVLRAASLGKFVPPASREMKSYRESNTGHELTSVALLYEDPQVAEDLDSVAPPLLEQYFGLQSEALDLEGVEQGRLWSMQGYMAVSFRIGKAWTFAGSTLADDQAYANALALAARDRMQAGLDAIRAEATETSLTAPP